MTKQWDRAGQMAWSCKFQDLRSSAHRAYIENVKHGSMCLWYQCWRRGERHVDPWGSLGSQPCDQWPPGKSEKQMRWVMNEEDTQNGHLTSTHMYMCTPTHMCMYTPHTCTYLPHTHVHVHLHTLHVHPYTHVHMHPTYTCAMGPTHTCTCTHTHMCMSAPKHMCIYTSSQNSECNRSED